MGHFKQCPSGHYYDENLPSCPYCSPGRGGLDRSPQSNLSRDVDSYEFKTADPSQMQQNVSGGTVFPTGEYSGNSYGPLSRGAGADYHDGMTAAPDGNDNGKTQILHPKKPKANGQPADDSPEQNSLVVGWLVAVEGYYRGKSFELHEGYNYIGSKAGDIVLDKDTAISREKNFHVMYSIKNNRFKIGAGQSTNIVYLNDDELDAGSSQILNAYDLIEIGNSKFRFVPFCGEQFTW